MRKIGILLIVFLLCLATRETVQRQEEWESVIPRKKEKTIGTEIRVVLTTDNFENLTHSEIRVSSEHGLMLFYGNESEDVKAKADTLTADSEADAKSQEEADAKAEAEKER